MIESVVQLGRTKDLSSLCSVLPQHRVVQLKVRLAIYTYTTSQLGFFILRNSYRL